LNISSINSKLKLNYISPVDHALKAKPFKAIRRGVHRAPYHIPKTSSSYGEDGRPLRRRWGIAKFWILGGTSVAMYKESFER